MPARAAPVRTTRPILGVDIGGSGIKAAPVDARTGQLAEERVRIETPQPATPSSVSAVVAELAKRFSPITGRGPIGVTYPGVVKDGVTRTAANVDKQWIGCNAVELFRKSTGRRCTVMNDADAAAMAELRFGAARAGGAGTRRGRATPTHRVVLLLTFGTGIGSGLIVDGNIVEGVELGHLRINGIDAEDRASANARDAEGLSWKAWANRVDEYLRHVETILWPDLIVLGGGVSERADKWVPKLKTRTPLAVATLGNDAGIVGAALRAGGVDR